MAFFDFSLWHWVNPICLHLSPPGMFVPGGIEHQRCSAVGPTMARWGNPRDHLRWPLRLSHEKLGKNDFTIFAYFIWFRLQYVVDIFRSISYGYRVLECRDPNRRDVVFEGGSGSCDFDAVINSAACFRILWYASCFMLFLDLVWVCRVHLKTSYERPKQIETMGSDPPWRCHPARPYLSRPSICGP